MAGMTMAMIMNSSSKDRLDVLADSAESAVAIPSKLDSLRRLNEILMQEDGDGGSLSGFLPRLFDLQSDEHSPVRRFVAQIIGEIGLRHVELVPEIVPVLMSVLEDSTPAVARQAISCAIRLFRSTLEKISIQGFNTSELDDTLKSSWSSMLELKEKIYSIAFQPGSGGVRLLALKFVETVILLYTPDPNGSLEPPPPHEGKIVEFNISWLRGGHPVLNVGDLAIEASKRLGLLLDQLRSPAVKSLSNLVIIVLINSLATIAKKRPPYYGRILPVLLGLGATNSVIEGKYASGTYHALKNGFLTCLNCTHPGAAPWRDRLVGALREMQAEGLAQEVLHQTFKSNGIVEEGKEDLLVAKEEKPLSKTGDGMSNKLGRKRFELEHSSDLAEDEDLSGKRVRNTPSVSEESSRESNMKITVSTDDSPSDGPATNIRTEDNGPVQQLVAMFGALVAQGEKAISSLDILISSISSDLLAEVVMANMRYLPPCPPQVEGEDESLLNITMVAKYPSSFLAGVLSLSSSFPPIASQLNTHCSISSDILKSQGEEEVQVAAIADSTVTYAVESHGANTEMLSSGLPAPLNATLSGVEMDTPPIPSDYHDIANLEHEIPGLDSSARSDGFPETIASTDLEEASQDQGTISGGRPIQDMLSSVSTDRSEELSPKAAVMDSNNLISSTATSLDLPHTCVLPKMTAPVVDLADEQKDQLQNLAFVRIIEAYKQIAVAGGSQVRFSLLADLGVELPSELDPWKLLQTHVLADYVTNEGHELTLRVLYRLFREVEEERDFFSSTTAASVYEAFLLTVAETLRDSFPPSDKSLSKLLGEAPYLPKPVLSLLESLCSPGNSDKAEKELQSGDRVTQGLSAVWNLILLRPPIREDCLRIALQSAVHHLQEVRMKAIRLVANKLFPLSSISQQIEEFAKEMLLSVATGDAEGMDVEESISDLQKGSNFDKPSNEHPSVSGSKDVSSDTPQSVTSQTVSSQSIPEAQRCMALYFALCTKKHSLFRQIFAVYNSASSAVKQAVHRHVPILVRTMGSSLELLEIISDPPSGSKNLLMQVLQTLTEGTVPSPELISTIKKLYDSKLKDADILIPILPFLPRDEVLLIFPNLVNLPPEKFQVALARILKGSSHSGPVLSPSEVLIAIHGIDPDRDGIPLKKVTDACNACFEQRQIFTQPVLAKVLNQLVEQTPLPLLFMRTVLQTIGAFPGLVEFIIEILSRLVSKQIWKYPKLWVGFLKCAFLTKDQSCGVLLQLPPQQLENALTRNAALKEPLTDYAKKPNVKSSLPRSVLAVLGLAPDVHSSIQAQSSVQTSFSAQTSQIQSSPARTQSSPAQISQEQSSLAQTIQRHSSPAQTSQGLSSPAQTSQGQSTQAHTGDTSNSDKDVVTEKSKESSVAS